MEKEGSLVHSKPYKNDLDLVRMEMTVPLSVETCTKLFFSDMDAMVACDPGLESGKFLEFYNENQYISYMVTKKLMWGMDKRDTLFAMELKDYKNGKIIIGTSVEHEKAPITKKYIRMISEIMGYVILPDEKNLEHTRLISVAHVDIGGSFPKSFMKKFI